jgi:hypothetical protein
MGLENGKNINENIAILLEKEVLYPGDKISGTIKCKIPEKININDIIIKLKNEEGYIERIQKGKNSHTVKKNSDNIMIQIFLNLKQYLNINKSLVTLEPGEYIFPFNFIIPDFIQPSFSFNFNSGKGYNHYYIIIELDIPYGTKINFNPKSEKTIIILSYSQKLGKDLFFSKENEIYKWGLSFQGTINLSAFYPKNYFIYDENIPLKITIDNTLGGMEVNYINIKLIRNIIFYKYNYFGNNLYHTCIIINKEIYINVKPGETSLFNYELILKNNDLNKNYGQISLNLPSVSLENLKCEYFIEIYIAYESATFSGSKPKLILPIFIGHKYKDDSFKNISEKYNNNYLNDLNINNINDIPSNNERNINNNNFSLNNEKNIDEKDNNNENKNENNNNIEKNQKIETPTPFDIFEMNRGNNENIYDNNNQGNINEINNIHNNININNNNIQNDKINNVLEKIEPKNNETFIDINSLE